MRERTVWTWKLLAYPLVAGMLALVLWGKGYVADRQAGQSIESVHAAAPVVSATPYQKPIQGVTGDGKAYVWERKPKYPMIEFKMFLYQKDRLV